MRRMLLLGRNVDARSVARLDLHPQFPFSLFCVGFPRLFCPPCVLLERLNKIWRKPKACFSQCTGIWTLVAYGIHCPLQKIHENWIKLFKKNSRARGDKAEIQQTTRKSISCVKTYFLILNVLLKMYLQLFMFSLVHSNHNTIIETNVWNENVYL